jgi:TolB-like protein/class 3 adenylate cyclase/Flp pilus assembly protein TadD
MPPVRRLTAILAADVAGYSRLMGVDEEGTHERLKAHLGELVDPKINDHRGRVVKNTGDGFLAEFASVVDAVRCAVKMQRGMAERNVGVAALERIEFRIGINLGDVIVEEHDIFGDGVNVAARLEGLAEPGGICVSGTVRDHIGDRLPYVLDDIGEQSVKNIARPVRAYAWRPEGTADLPTTSVPIAVPMRRRRSIFAPIGAAVATMLVIAVVTWWFWPTTRSPSIPPAAVAAATSNAQPLIAPRLSIAVLPFANLSKDPDQQYFADGITEDLTTDLSRIAHMLVISRNTAFAYRDKTVSAKQIGRELGVRYVLEGSVQRSGNQVRINAQLINAETDAHLWAERFDHDTGDLFALQNEITGRIAHALNLRLIGAEAARPTDNPGALDYIFRGRAAGAKPPSPEKYQEAIDLFERALALDPQSFEAQGLLAIALTGRVLDGMTNSRQADIKRAEALVEQVSTAAPRSWWAHWAKGQVLRAETRFDDAIPEYEAALALYPNNPSTLHVLGQCKFNTGSIDQTISLEEQAIRLSPRDPQIGNWYEWIGRVHLLQSHFDEAIIWFEKARSANPRHPNPHIFLASSYALQGEIERAGAELTEARRLRGEGSFSSIARLRRGYWGVPAVRELYDATYFAGLRKAGMPEE